MNPIFDMPLVTVGSSHYRKTTVKEIPGVFLCKEHPLKGHRPRFFIGDSLKRVCWMTSGEEVGGGIVCRCHFDGACAPIIVSPDEVAYIEEVVMKWKK